MSCLLMYVCVCVCVLLTTQLHSKAVIFRNTSVFTLRLRCHNAVAPSQSAGEATVLPVKRCFAG